MKNVKYLCGNENVDKLPLPVYADEVCDFLNELSNVLMKASELRLYPDLSALAFWCRKANIQKLKTDFGDVSGFVGKGLCFHIAPSNIPINFAFSYLFSLLAGNANIVRLPSKEFPQVDFLCETLNNVLENYPNIKAKTALVKYSKESLATADFSKVADARMIWGGDATIKSLKLLDTKPRCVDIAFADRYSICLIDAEKILAADDVVMQRLAENFYTDTYLMDQNACSSPQLIYWLNDNKAARDKFWQYVFKNANKKYVLQDAVVVDKYTQMCEDAIGCCLVKDVRYNENLLYRVELNSINENVEKLRGKGGYFYEYALHDMAELFKVVNEKYQTITYFGIDAQRLRDSLVIEQITGVDRIVPIGKAMDIGVFWDGHDLVRELSRKIVIM